MVQQLPALIVWLVVLTFACCAGALRADSIPKEEDHVRSLDGTWRFKLEQAGDHPAHGHTGGKPEKIVMPKHPEPFQKLDYKEDSTWHDLKVPGNWEMSGYSPATYNQPDNAIGIYRLWFEIPADWKGRDVRLNFDGVQNGAEIYLNGQPVDVTEPAWGRKNYHEGGWDAFQVELTPAVKFGQKNLLAIRVTKNTKSVDMDTGDYYFLGGIHRTVTLYSVPKTHLGEFAVRTKLLDGNKAELRVIADIVNPTDDATVTMRLEGYPPIQAQVANQKQIEIVQTLDNPKLWSAEHPNLYTLKLDLKGPHLSEHIEKRIGVREVSIKKGVLLVNNVPVKLAGMCRHDVFPEDGTALTEADWRKDIELMKAANVNAIRTSHYPYGSKFYDLCDELGMYVADEMACCWAPVNTDELTPRFEQHARELVLRDRNHPSVIIWAVGNENGKGKNNKVAADEMKRLDPTRPRLVSIHDAEEGNVEFDDRHYPTVEALKRELGMTERREKYPLICLEGPNDWDGRNGADYGNFDRWAPVLDREWDVIWPADHMPGSFLWEWQDRAVATPHNPVHLYDYYPDTGIELVKVKGICDGWRNPRPWYYHVKVVYAPIKADLKPELSDSGVAINVTNYYSFTDLSELKTTWHLMKGDKEIGSGNQPLRLAPRSKGKLELKLPKDKLAGADSLRLDFDHPGGTNIVTYLLELRPHPTPPPALDSGQLSDVHFPKLNLVTRNRATNPWGWWISRRRPASMRSIRVQVTGSGSSRSIDEAALYAMPLSGIRSLDADLIVRDFESMTPRKRAKKPQPPHDPSKLTPVGHLHVDFENGHFSYKVDWTGPKADIQEVGWIFEMPTSLDHFSWNRKAYWSWYPPKHIGRPSGTATPDSANVDVTKMGRPDSFDFNSTKYDCNWADLTDRSGTGLGVRFSADQRQHCRGEIRPDGAGYGLVVNRTCASPRDISTNIVPEQYLTLQKGQSVQASFEVGKVKAGL